nr:glycosyltransferase family 29 protein [Bacteroidota bacterium]
MLKLDIFEFRDRYADTRSIAFVGNSSSVLSFENGKLIDSYDMVVRFNRAYTKGIEDKVGAKTTVLISNDINCLSRSPSPSEVLNPECIVSFIKPKSKMDIDPLREWFHDIPYVITLSPDVYNLNTCTRTRSLTMGTYTLYSFLRLFEPEKIFITGFTMFGMAPGGGGKYFEKDLDRSIGRFHDLDEEAKIFKQILKEFKGNIKMTR